ncbi:hypothetical protein N0V90_007155 [Kalmusia sp. IMI 367209]|nr:hypothetical protein N0V90_007155 [Kalmusia sp. IMI 367209]
MFSIPARPQFICQSCINTFSKYSKSSYPPGSHAQWARHKSSASSFRIAKHFARGRDDQKRSKSALKLDLDDGQPIPARFSYKRIPLGAPRTKIPIHTVRLPDAPSVHMPVEARRVEHERPRVTERVMIPSFIYKRQFSRRTLRKSKGEEAEELVPSEPSPPLAGPVKIWAAEKPVTHAKLHFGSLQDWNWYWETIPPTISEKTQAQHFFTKKASPKFLQSVAFFRAFPESDVPEIAFVGRSNVGKSSLLNAIVNADTKALLARTSSTPGFTKTMNLYGLGPNSGVHLKKQPSGYNKIVGTGGITIVDMPGYGEGSLSEWGIEIMKYLQGRKQLRRVFVLMDAKHGIKDKDRSLLASLRIGGIPHQVILSKLDKLYIPEAKEIKRFDGKCLDKLKPTGNLEQLKKTMDKIRTEIQPPVGGGALGEILGCSSEVLVNGRRLGIDAVRFAMLQAIGFAFRSDGQAVEAASKSQEPRIRMMKTNRKNTEPVIRALAS